MTCLGRTRKKYRLDLTSHRRVHTCHLGLIVEISPITQAAQYDGRAVARRRIDRKIVEGRNLYRSRTITAKPTCDVFEHGNPHVGIKQRGLGVVHAHADNETIKHPRPPTNDVEMPIGDRIETARVKRTACHDALIAEARRNGKCTSGRPAIPYKISTKSWLPRAWNQPVMSYIA